MEKIEINISSEDVYAEVYRLSENVGARHTGDDAALYEHIRVTKYNKDMLDDFFNDAKSTANTSLAKYVTATILSPSQIEVYKATLMITSRVNPLFLRTIKDTLKNFFIHYIFARWCDMCNVPDIAKGETDAYVALMSDIITQLNTYIYPKKIDKGGKTKMKGKETW